MKITNVRIKLADGNNEHLLAFASVVLENAIVIHEIKIINGLKGAFVAMPTRRITFPCRCGCKNCLTARYCNNCGTRLPRAPEHRDGRGRPRMHCDVVHPVSQEFRDQFEDAVFKAYEEEMALSRQPGYMPHDFDFTDV